jgi:hypothetical protein
LLTLFQFSWWKKREGIGGFLGYMALKMKKKKMFLQELRDLRALCAGPWLVAGDWGL